MPANETLKVSYCTTCKGRLHHLQETLPANLEAEKHNPNVEFVILDYGSEDGLSDWIKTNYQLEIDSGRIKYARLDDAPHFKMAHAKNMAHRLATGDILCNLDADNFIPKNYSPLLRARFEENPKAIISHHAVTLKGDWDFKVGKRLRKERRPDGGEGGRIVLSRQAFNDLGGYDEKFTGWAPDDRDLVLRSHQLGYSVMSPTDKEWGDVIRHSHDERVKHLSEGDAEKSSKRLNRHKAFNFINGMKVVIAPPDPHVNLDGQVGCGIVHVNFHAEPEEIGLLHNKVANETAADELEKNDQIRWQDKLVIQAANARQAKPSPKRF